MKRSSRDAGMKKFCKLVDLEADVSVSIDRDGGLSKRQRGYGVRVYEGGIGLVRNLRHNTAVPFHGILHHRMCV